MRRFEKIIKTELKIVSGEMDFFAKTPVNWTMELFEKHPQWPNVQFVCRKLADAGFVAYLAGGSVRDALLGVQAQDFDVATDATPDQVEELFEKTVGVGKAFGVIVVPFEQGNIEVATFRTDGNYRDGRRPDQVQFSSAKEDARRRDFTVNALFYDPIAKCVVDYVQGESDLDRRVLTTVGDARERFNEDGLRLLRAVRFAAQVGLEIERQTYSAILEMKENLRSISIERIRDEICKMLRGPRPVMALQLLYDTGLGGLLFGSPSLQMLSNTKKRISLCRKRDTSIVLAVLYAEKWVRCDLRGSSMTTLQKRVRCFTRENLSNWKLSKGVLGEIELLLIVLVVFRHHQEYLFKDLRKLFSRGYVENTLAFLQSFRGDFLRSKSDSAWKEVAVWGTELPKPLLTGKDLLDHGVPPGPDFKMLLDESLDRQIEGKSENRKQALSWLEERLAK